MTGRTFHPTDRELPELWRTAMLGIPGARPVTVAMSSDRAGCATLAAAMLKCEESDLDLAMIDDSMRELVNMTAGQIKAELSLDQPLGVPRVIDGELLATTAAWTHWVLRSETIRIVVSLVAAIT
ncbi:MAG: chemotaxis protein CheX [Kofleriaceae bacterium]